MTTATTTCDREYDFTITPAGTLRIETVKELWGPESDFYKHTEALNRFWEIVAHSFSGTHSEEEWQHLWAAAVCGRSDGLWEYTPGGVSERVDSYVAEVRKASVALAAAFAAEGVEVDLTLPDGQGSSAFSFYDASAGRVKLGRGWRYIHVVSDQDNISAPKDIRNAWIFAALQALGLSYETALPDRLPTIGVDDEPTSIRKGIETAVRGAFLNVHPTSEWNGMTCLYYGSRDEEGEYTVWPPQEDMDQYIDEMCKPSPEIVRILTGMGVECGLEGPEEGEDNPFGVVDVAGRVRAYGEWEYIVITDSNENTYSPENVRDFWVDAAMMAKGLAPARVPYVEPPCRYCGGEDPECDDF